MLKLACFSAAELGKVEALNNISINVFAYEEHQTKTDDGKGSGRRRATFFPVYVSKNKAKEGDTVNLLLVCNDDTQHYVLITSLSGLLNGMEGASKHKRLTHYCYHCLHGLVLKN